MIPNPDTQTGPAADAETYLERIHRNKGVGGWRSLYLRLLETTALSGYGSVLEIGAGSADFLLATSAARRLAVDISGKYRHAFEAAGIGFAQRDLESQDLASLGSFDVAVCSDVFEHLLQPAKALGALKAALEPEGILFSHVPNEYRLATTLRIMMGLQEGLYFHTEESEWTDPHIRRFTDRGFRRFLAQSFEWNVRITHLRYRGVPRFLHLAGLNVPFCLQGGPTYVSTNSQRRHAAILDAVRSVR